MAELYVWRAIAIESVPLELASATAKPCGSLFLVKHPRQVIVALASQFLLRRTVGGQNIVIVAAIGNIFEVYENYILISICNRVLISNGFWVPFLQFQSTPLLMRCLDVVPNAVIADDHRNVRN